jgi:aminotransferase
MTQPALADRLFSQRARAVRAIFPRQTSVVVPGLLNISSGTPDFDTPAHIVEAGAKALKDGQTRYTLWAGLPELRQAIADKFKRDNGLIVNPDTEVLVTTGTQEALFFIMQTVLDPGDEMITASPFYDEYRRDVMLAGGTMVTVPTRAENAFEIDPAEIEKRITPRTKGIIVISPSNPTGAVQPRAVLEAIAHLAQKHNFLVISDELYEKFNYGPHAHFSLATLPGMHERTITINGFSKCYGMTGWRVGYLAAPENIIHMMLPIKHGMTICAPAVSQWAALAALTGPHDWFDNIMEEYGRRRQLWMKSLTDLGFGFGEPRGAYYILFDVQSSGLTADEFARRMREEYKVTLGSMSSIGPDGQYLIRGSLATPTAELEEAMVRMKTAVTAFRNERGGA